MLPCVSTTPFGLPVVPEVYNRIAMSDAERFTGVSSGDNWEINGLILIAPSTSDSPNTSRRLSIPARFIASLSRGACEGEVKRMDASESDRIFATSGAVHCGITGTIDAPIVQIAGKEAINSGEFGIITSVRSPEPTP